MHKSVAMEINQSQEAGEQNFSFAAVKKECIKLYKTHSKAIVIGAVAIALFCFLKSNVVRTVIAKIFEKRLVEQKKETLVERAISRMKSNPIAQEAYEKYLSMN